jgi:hypothetical protein
MAVAVGGLAQLLAAVYALEGVRSVHWESKVLKINQFTYQCLAKVTLLDIRMSVFI